MDNDEVAINFALTQKPKSKDKKINETIIRPNTKEGWTFVEIFRLYFFFFWVEGRNVSHYYQNKQNFFRWEWYYYDYCANDKIELDNEIKEKLRL